MGLAAGNRISIRHLKNCFSSPQGLTFKINIRNTVTTALRMDVFFSAYF